ncbi:uncharacterized protein LACBIDRAFT_313006 [Laccaria bicolor S238N-H82]|uniref:Predicted protein n=1 Tax=Laccaria bicolor (strain S238N-H82 / ATCC MYA-4686) TaxID=486041 RepID=B0DXC0_LACBS|nr:uncharacterized protein LACBIDRAFT_313006 [Laccaria bicolor S238N-H82]EDR00811.1 predicted protein [Laccaria bicolor S238N-H82]|eukprot:XP_001888603.1 predicted protein [Laccaria bicolor S238N-H82]
MCGAIIANPDRKSERSLILQGASTPIISGGELNSVGGDYNRITINFQYQGVRRRTRENRHVSVSIIYSSLRPAESQERCDYQDFIFGITFLIRLVLRSRSPTAEGQSTRVGTSKFTLRWVAVHKGVTGNERVDKEAKRAAQGDSSTQEELPPILRKHLPYSASAVK